MHRHLWCVGGERVCENVYTCMPPGLSTVSALLTSVYSLLVRHNPESKRTKHTLHSGVAGTHGFVHWALSAVVLVITVATEWAFTAHAHPENTHLACDCVTGKQRHFGVSRGQW